VIKDALREGDIDLEVAGYVARIHSPKLQEKALASIKSNHLDLEDGGKRSARKIREFLKEKYTLKLSEAIFDTQDAFLLENAGACTTCPKRVANAPTYQDLNQPHESSWGSKMPAQPNLCTDPECFEAKKKAHLRLKATALEEKGKTVIDGSKARSLISAQGELKNCYVPLKDVKAELAKAKGKKGHEGMTVTTVVIQNPRDGKTVEAVKVGDLEAVGVRVKEKPSHTSAHADWQQRQEREEEARRKRLEKAQLQTKIHVALLGEVRRAAAGQGRSAFDLRMVARVAVQGVGWQQRNLLALMHGAKDVDALAKKIDGLPVEDLTTLMLDCALVQSVVVDAYDNDKPVDLLAAAAHYGVDVERITAAVKASPDGKTEDYLKPLPPAGATDRAAQAKAKPAKGGKAAAERGAGRGRKLSAAEAKSGIADAMQSMGEPEGGGGAADSDAPVFALGERVQVKATVNRAKRAHAGKVGTVCVTASTATRGAVGVNLDGESKAKSFDAADLERWA
jgi:hypothetical protein